MSNLRPREGMLGAILLVEAGAEFPSKRTASNECALPRRLFRRFRKNAKILRSSFFIGIRSRMYGFSVLGAVPCTTRVARAAICAPLGCRKPGGCLTTGLALHGLSAKDPAVTIPKENVIDFIAAHMASDHGMVTAKHWPSLVQKLGPTGRWSRVFGPLSSATATLLDVGWQLPSIQEWHAADGAV